jgi:hypothetical protein
VPSVDAVIREQVRTASRGSRRPAVQVMNRHPVTVTPDAVSKLYGFVPYLHTLVCTNVASLNALPVELLRCPHLKIVTASPQLIIMPPPEITVGMFLASPKCLLQLDFVKVVWNFRRLLKHQAILGRCSSEWCDTFSVHQACVHGLWS